MSIDSLSWSHPLTSGTGGFRWSPGPLPTVTSRWPTSYCPWETGSLCSGLCLLQHMQNQLQRAKAQLTQGCALYQSLFILWFMWIHWFCYCRVQPYPSLPPREKNHKTGRALNSFEGKRWGMRRPVREVRKMSWEEGLRSGEQSSYRE